MAALPPFLGFVAKEADFETLRAQRVTRRRGAVRVGRRGVRFGVHHDLQPALHLRRLRQQGQTPTRASASPKCTALQRHSWSHRPSWRRRAWCSASGLPGLDHVLDALRRHGARRRGLPPRPLARRESAAAAVDPGARLPASRAFVVRVAAAPRLADGLPAAGQRRSDLRRRHPRRRRLRGATHRGDPARIDTRRRRRSSCRRWCCCRW